MLLSISSNKTETGKSLNQNSFHIKPQLIFIIAVLAYNKWIKQLNNFDLVHNIITHINNFTVYTDSVFIIIKK